MDGTYLELIEVHVIGHILSKSLIGKSSSTFGLNNTIDSVHLIILKNARGGPGGVFIFLSSV
jgi:hypothetical protein